MNEISKLHNLFKNMLIAQLPWLTNDDSHDTIITLCIEYCSKY